MAMTKYQERKIEGYSNLFKETINLLNEEEINYDKHEFKEDKLEKTHTTFLVSLISIINHIILKKQDYEESVKKVGFVNCDDYIYKEKGKNIYLYI